MSRTEYEETQDYLVMRWYLHHKYPERSLWRYIWEFWAYRQRFGVRRALWCVKFNVTHWIKYQIPRRR